jgi:hypothetical protein
MRSAAFWWRDPGRAALVISFVAVKEGRESWRGEVATAVERAAHESR